MSLKETISSTSVADRILIIILLSISLTGVVFIRTVIPSNGDVSVNVDNRITYRYSLDSDRLVKIESNTGYLTLEIKDRKARVAHASCPNKQCEHQGWVSNGAIICLPNRIFITVGGWNEFKNRKLDAISGQV